MILDFSRYTSIKIGPVREVEEIADIRGFDGIIIGGGNNILISPDAAIKMAVLSKKYDFIEVLGGGCLRVGAGASAKSVHKMAKKLGLGGFEFLAQIPGQMGGVITMNAGLKGHDISRILHSVKTQRGEILKEDCGFRYRGSVFSDFGFSDSGFSRVGDGELGENGGGGGGGEHSAVKGGGAVILSEAKNLKKEFGGGDLGGDTDAWSGDLSEKGGERPIIFEAILRGDSGYSEALESELAAARKNQPSGASFGSCFKNPPNDAAGRLLEAVGLRGFRRGGCGFSDKHANFLINHGGGSFEAALWLIEEAKRRVADFSGITLEPEVVIVG